MRCPECLSDDFEVHAFDFGEDPTTGYRDAPKVFVCRRCGKTGDIDELLPDEPTDAEEETLP